MSTARRGRLLTKDHINHGESEIAFYSPCGGKNVARLLEVPAAASDQD
jgi:hypothetical protein